MRIAIIGTGHVGGAITRGLTGKAHNIVLGARDPARPVVQALVSLHLKAGLRWTGMNPGPAGVPEFIVDRCTIAPAHGC